MSATELINEVQELPIAEQERVLNFLEEKLRPRKPADGVKHATDADFEKAADKVFRENDNLFRRLAQ
jgi:transcriptional regulator with AAA-type ATPase domain